MAPAGVAFPTNEDARIEALRALGILDTTSEDVFEDIARAAAEACSASMAMVCFVDSERLWFKAAVGTKLPESPRDWGFCSAAILQREPLIVPDALDDPRFAQNPLVMGETGARYYAGVPLLDRNGLAVGTLCVLDSRPRAYDEDISALQMLAVKTMSLLKQRARHSPRGSRQRSVGGTLDIVQAGDKLVLTVAGALVQPHAVEFADRALAKMSDRVREVVVDLDQCQHVDSGGVAVLVRILKAARQRNLGFRVVNARPNVTALFKLLRLDKMMGLAVEAIDAA